MLVGLLAAPLARELGRACWPGGLVFLVCLACWCSFGGVVVFSVLLLRYCTTAIERASRAGFGGGGFALRAVGFLGCSSAVTTARLSPCWPGLPCGPRGPVSQRAGLGFWGGCWLTWGADCAPCVPRGGNVRRSCEVGVKGLPLPPNFLPDGGVRGCYPMARRWRAGFPCCRRAVVQ